MHPKLYSSKQKVQHSVHELEEWVGCSEYVYQLFSTLCHAFDFNAEIAGHTLCLQ